MIAKHPWGLRLPISLLLVTLAGVGCTSHDNRPAAPATADPAPPAAVTPAEDRGKEAAAEAPAPASDESAFGHVDGGEAERAASKRGHDSAGEAAPGGSGG